MGRRHECESCAFYFNPGTALTLLYTRWVAEEDEPAMKRYRQITAAGPSCQRMQSKAVSVSNLVEHVFSLIRLNHGCTVSSKYVRGCLPLIAHFGGARAEHAFVTRGWCSSHCLPSNVTWFCKLFLRASPDSMPSKRAGSSSGSILTRNETVRMRVCRRCASSQD